MQAVNLLPRELVEGRKRPPAPVLAACGGGVLVAAVLAMMYLSASQKVASAQKTLDEVTAQYEAIPAPPPPSPLVAQVPQEKQARVGALAVVLGQRVVWDRLLREVSEVVPSDVWLTSVTAQSPTYATGSAAPAPPTAGATLPQGFVVDGCTYSQASVARFLARLQLVPDLTQVTLGKAETQEGPAGATDGSGGGSGGGSAGGGCPGGMVEFNVAGNVQLGASS